MSPGNEAAAAAAQELASRRGRCRYCGKTYALTFAGRVRKHMVRSKTGGRVFCGGGGQVPS